MAALTELGARLSDVVRIRIYITDISQYEATAVPLRAAFADTPPTAALVEVSSFLEPEMMV